MLAGSSSIYNKTANNVRSFVRSFVGSVRNAFTAPRMALMNAA